MNSFPKHDERGFTLMEVLIAMMITMIVMASVFALLHKGQESFRREPQVADMNANARSGLSRISQDLTYAGYNTPPTMSIMWFDGGGITPDELTIVYSDPNIPTSRPKPCGTTGGGGGGGGGGPCNTIGMSSVLNIDPLSFSDEPQNFEDVYQDGMILMAIQGPNGDPACDAVPPGVIPFEVTQPPTCTGAGGATSGPSGCATLNINHNPAGTAQINVPGGFNNDVSNDCATIGVFHVVQYRVNPLPPTPEPVLERRDIVLGEPWTPVAVNIENLQVQYAQGVNNVFNDVPPLVPVGNDLNSWVTQVQVTVAGRSASTNLQGGTQGVFAADDTHMRRTFSTVVSLRNQLGQAAIKAIEDGIPMAWN